jgi:hypothetical protein
MVERPINTQFMATLGGVVGVVLVALLMGKRISPRRQPADQLPASHGTNFPGTGAFMAGAGILLAAILTWVSFWNANEPNGAFALVWLYAAAVLDLSALSIVGYHSFAMRRTMVSVWAVALLVAAFELLFLQVLQSIASNALRVFAHLRGFYYCPVAVETWFVIVAAVLGPTIAVSALWGTRTAQSTSPWWRILPWVVNGLAVLGLGIAVILLMLQALQPVPCSSPCVVWTCI